MHVTYFLILTVVVNACCQEGNGTMMLFQQFNLLFVGHTQVRNYQSY